MDKKSYSMKSYKTVLISCNKTSLLKGLKEQFKRRGFLLIFINKEKKGANKIKEEEGVIQLDDLSEVKKKISKIDYFLYFSETRYLDNDKKKNNNIELFEKEVGEYQGILNKYQPKAVFIINGLYKEGINSNAYNKIVSYFDIVKTRGAVILYGDLISERFDRDSLGRLQKILIEITSGKKVKVCKSDVFYPILKDELLSYLEKITFSLRAYEKTTFIAGRRINITTLIDLLGKNNFKLLKGQIETKIFPYDEKIISKKQSKRVLKKVIDNMKMNVKYKKKVSILNFKNGYRSLVDHKKSFFRGIRSFILKFNNIFVTNKKRLLFSTLLLYFLLPVILFSLTIFSMYISKTFFLNDLPKASLKLSKTSRATSKINKGFLKFNEEIPFISDYFGLFSKSVSIVSLQSRSLNEAVEVFNSYLSILDFYYENSKLGNEEIFKRIVFNLDSIYQDLGFLESEIKSSDRFETKLATLTLQEIDLDKVRSEVLLLKQITDNLLQIVKEKGSSEYALVFQNNSILRPTGGRIESLLTFDINDFSVDHTKLQDASQIDRDLTGRIDPPPVIKKFFATDNWYLKDANWDPDFPTSANQIETFINRENDLSLKGLIAVDKQFILELISVIYNKNIENSEIDLIESEESDDYPQGYEKLPLTRILEKNFGEELYLSQRKKSKVLKNIYHALGNKNIQIHIEDVEISKNIIDLGWGGSFAKNDSDARFFSDNISLIETGIDGESTKIKREASLEIYFEEGLIKRELKFYLENKGLEEYKGYLRLFANENVGFSPIRFVYSEKEDLVEPEINSAKGLKEVGVYFEVKSGKTMGTIFKWEGTSEYDFDSRGEYQISWRKQAGVEEYPVKITLHPPKGVETSSSNAFSLTDGGVFIYNTSLDRDLNPSIFW